MKDLRLLVVLVLVASVFYLAGCKQAAEVSQDVPAVGQNE